MPHSPAPVLFATPDPSSAKDFGAFYTDALVARFLSAWAIRQSTDRVVDPSFGGGVFLLAAGERLRQLGGDPQEGVFGVELDPRVHGLVATQLETRLGVPPRNLTCADFFSRDPSPTYQAVVGNPPFIRYQRFSGEARARALSRALNQGVKLSSLTSSWAPFLVHAASMLEAGGRLAMVAPVELWQASYARPVLPFLARAFRETTFLTFRALLFPELSEDTLLVLADGRGEPFVRFAHLDLAGPKALEPLLEGVSRSLPPLETGLKRAAGGKRAGRKGTATPEPPPPSVQPAADAPLETAESDASRAADRAVSQTLGASPGARLEAPTLDWERYAAGLSRFGEQYLPEDTRQLYHALAARSDVQKLGSLAEVGIGYVSGANDFFHLSPDEARLRGLPEHRLRPAVRRARALRGLRLTRDDWAVACASADAGYLLWVDERVPQEKSLKAYLKAGEALGVPAAYKCRVRGKWYQVPHVYQADALLTYMSGVFPRLVVADLPVVAPNTLHVVRLKEAFAGRGLALAVGWYTSLAQLSAELEGHALGGGMLKLEPGEAGRVLLPFLDLEEKALDTLAQGLDERLRAGAVDEAVALADRVLLCGHLGLRASDVAGLQAACRLLRERRMRR